MSIRAFRGRRQLRAFAAFAMVAGSLVAAAGASALTPPDGRAYELVSPPNKLGAVPNFPGGLSTVGFPDYATVTAASANGARMIWFSTGAFVNAGSAVPMNYFSSRTNSGWTTSQLSPDVKDLHPNALLTQARIADATDDLLTRVISTTQAYDPNATALFRTDLYRQDADGTLTWLTRPLAGPPVASGIRPEYDGRDLNANHVLFTTPELLNPVGNAFGPDLYDRTGAQPVLVGVDDGGTPIGSCGAELGFIPPFANAAFDFRVLTHAVSDDGSHIFFTTPNRDSSGDPSCDALTQLYLRLNGTTTVHVSASQRTTADPQGPQPVAFQGASADGSKVFFQSNEALTNDAADGDGLRLLYEYDVPSSTLSLVTPNSSGDPDVQGVVAVSDDASHVYLIAKGVLAAGATLNQLNLYSYAGGQFTFIGSMTDAFHLLKNDFGRQARVTADGSSFAFISSSNLTAYDSGGFEEVYLYDATQNHLTCISCPTSGAPAHADAFLQEDGGVFYKRQLSRNIVDGGRRVFFESPEALVPQDDNGVMDVYEWEDGQVHLISGGHGTEGSYFADASIDGRDVFFSTVDQLAPQDIDSDPDFYDARIGGGFKLPAGSSVCIDDQCQGQPSAPPTLAGVATGTDFGLGNVTPGHKASLSVAAISAKARRGLARTGSLRLRVHVGRAGTARVVATTRLGKRSARVGHGKAHAARAGLVRVRLKLSRAAMRRLAASGRLRVTIVVTFPGAASRHATLVLTQPANGNR